MRLKTTNDALVAFYDEKLMQDARDPPGIIFYESGISREVPSELGRQVVDAYDSISIHSTADPTASGDT